MSGSHSGVPLKSTLLMRLEVLIRQAREQLEQFTDGKTQFIAYVRALREQIQHCLVDIVDRGEPAQEDLREVMAMDLSISDELAAWYAKGVYNDFQVKEGDPADFLRAQAEYDRTMPPKIQRMIALLQQVKGKMLGTVPSASPTPVPQAGSPSHGQGAGELGKQYSQRDRALYELIGSEDLARFTDAELWKRKAKDFRKMQTPGRKATQDAFRARLFRIRHYHGVPAPKL